MRRNGKTGKQGRVYPELHILAGGGGEGGR